MVDTRIELKVLINRGQELLDRINGSLEPGQVTRFNSSEVASWFNAARTAVDIVDPGLGESLGRFEPFRHAFTRSDIHAHREAVVKMMSSMQALLDNQTEPKPQARQAVGFDVFISYSTRDSAEAGMLAEEVRKAGATPFLAAKDIAPGEDFAERIRDVLAGCGEVWMLMKYISSRFAKPAGSAG